MIGNKKICIFVDGENLRHSIVELFPSFETRDYLPKKAQWEKFFEWIADEAVGKDRDLIRTYWYVVKDIDCFPYSLNSARKNPKNDYLKNILSRDHEIRKYIAITNDEKKLTNFLITKTDELIDTETMMRKRFAGWTTIQDEITGNNKSVEFRRAGSIKYNLFTKQLGSEKAVDVKLATDLIILKDIYDVAVIVSGDQDYVPAVGAIKDFGKRTVNIAFQKEDGQLLPSGAKRLNQSTDWSVGIKHQDFKKYLGL